MNGPAESSNKNGSFKTEKVSGEVRNNGGTPAKAHTYTHGDSSNTNPAESAKKNNVMKKPPVILDDDKSRISGKVKFLDEKKNFGFIVSDEDGCDIFVHGENLVRAGVSKNITNNPSVLKGARVTFAALTYIGRHNKSKKAVDVEFTDGVRRLEDAALALIDRN